MYLTLQKKASEKGYSMDIITSKPIMEMLESLYKGEECSEESNLLLYWDIDMVNRKIKLLTKEFGNQNWNISLYFIHNESNFLSNFLD